MILADRGADVGQASHQIDLEHGLPVAVGEEMGLDGQKKWQNEFTKRKKTH